MSLTGRKWTERQRFDFAEAKLAKWHAQRGLCATCTHYHQGVETMEWAHRIPDTKVNRRVYGKAVLSHPANGALVCKKMRAGRDCNASQILNGLAAAGLAARIEAALNMEGA